MDKAMEDFLQYTEISDLENAEESAEDIILDPSVNIENPNKNRNKKYFQEMRIMRDWDCALDYANQPNRLEDRGPVELDHPGHFYEVEGGIVVIGFEKDRSTSCLCSIIEVLPDTRSFKFQVFNCIGKSKKT